MFPYNPIYFNVDEIQKDSLKNIALYSERFLRFVPRTLINFPSHGVDHSISIINLINNFHENWGANLISEEIYLLYSTAWLHDIGCIRDRNNHNEISVEIFLADENICDSIREVNDRALTNITWIVKSHSSNFSIQDVPEEGGNGVRLQMISAIFRLIDSCEISYAKCPSTVFEEIRKNLVDKYGNPDKTALKYWRAHMSIRSILFKNPKIEIMAIDRRRIKTIIKKLNTEIASIEEVFNNNGVTVPEILII